MVLSMNIKMKKYLKKLKNPKIFIPLLLVIIISIPFVSYLLGNVTSSRYPNWSGRFKVIARYSSFGLLKEKQVVETQEKEEEESNLVTVSPSEIDIVNKRISVQSWDGQDMTSYMFSALLKNNSEYGIPKLVIKSIKIYDKDGSLIGEKEGEVTEGILTIVKDGEYPFSFGVIKEGRDWKPESFDIEIDIPDFEVNDDAVRLNITNLELVERLDRESAEVLHGWGFEYLNYTYDVSIKNITEQVVEDIYYIAFLKYKDSVFSTISDSCCTSVSFEKAQDPVSLDEPETFSTLQPGQEETLRIKMRPFDFLYEEGINEDEIELVFYAIGTI
jgi:hypothetical protein